MATPFMPTIITGGAGEADQEPELHRGQLRFAKRFTTEFAGKFLHAHGLGWHEYDGARWAECLDGAETRAVVDLLAQALGDLSALEKQARDDLIRDIQKLETANGIAGVLELAKTLHPCTIAAKDLDAQPYLLNTRGGTINLDDGTTQPPRAADHLSKVTAADFNPDAHDEVFDQFLERAHPDPDTRAFLARSLGSALLGLVREQQLFIWYGTGRNGKGTLRDAVLHALGDYAVEVPADILLMSKHGQQGLAPERMRLKGTRVAFCSEIANGARLDEATMKKLTGGDPVNARLLFRNPVQFDPSHQLVMLTNHLPTVRGDDPATWRRILAVPFDVVVPPEEVDHRLPEKLKGAADAVLAWLWRGWLDYQQQGLNPPESVRAATKKYQLDSDVLARFLADETAVLLGHGSIGSAPLYKAFTDWCRAEGEPTEMSNKAFSEAMENRGFSKSRTKAGATWKGLMVVDNSSEDRQEW